MNNFNLRVYGILIHNDSVLITHEKRSGLDMTKFPGGGLEKGEGLESCLIREFQEELNIEIEVAALFYVNEFLQISAFNPKDQLISFYYFVRAAESEILKINEQIGKLDLIESNQKFEWIKLNHLNSEQFTFPIDKIVVQKLTRDLD